MESFVLYLSRWVHFLFSLSSSLREVLIRVLILMILSISSHPPLFSSLFYRLCLSCLVLSDLSLLLFCLSFLVMSLTSIRFQSRHWINSGSHSSSLSFSFLCCFFFGTLVQIYGFCHCILLRQRKVLEARPRNEREEREERGRKETERKTWLPFHEKSLGNPFVAEPMINEILSHSLHGWTASSPCCKLSVFVETDTKCQTEGEEHKTCCWYSLQNFL